MSIQSIEYLKSRFLCGMIPTEQDFTDLIDTLANVNFPPALKSYKEIGDFAAGQNVAGGVDAIAQGVNVTSNSEYSLVGGGRYNQATQRYASVNGGCGNVASGCSSTVGGGKVNLASGHCSTVSGGFKNTASGIAATVGSGECNTASGLHSVIGGGKCNIANSLYSSVGGGGYGNTAADQGTTIAGGDTNYASGIYSTIGAGVLNTICCSYAAFIGGGQENYIVFGDFSGIIGGQSNVIDSLSDTFIAGSNIIANRSNTLFANNLSLMNLPTVSSGLPYGAIWNDNSHLRIVTAPDPIEFAIVSDSGQSGYLDDTRAVAALISSYNTDFVIHLGDANYGTPAQLDTNFTPYYQNMFHKMYFAFGNHDLDYDYGTAILNKLTLVDFLIGPTKKANKQLYYDFVRGPVHFFVFNSGNSAAGNNLLGGSDPYLQLTTQMNDLTSKMVASTSPWKFVIVHKPPYTNDSSHAPGASALRINYDALGADVVISGHAHNYELFNKDSTYYIVNGLGGAAKRGFVSPLQVSTGRISYYNAKNAFTKINVSTTQATFNVINKDNTVIDTLVLTK